MAYRSYAAHQGILFGSQYVPGSCPAQVWGSVQAIAHAASPAIPRHAVGQGQHGNQTPLPGNGSSFQCQHIILVQGCETGGSLAICSPQGDKLWHPDFLLGTVPSTAPAPVSPGAFHLSCPSLICTSSLCPWGQDCKSQGAQGSGTQMAPQSREFAWQ